MTSERNQSYEPGPHEMRQRFGVVQNDTKLFKPYELNECLGVSRLVTTDPSIKDDVKPVVRLGIVLDLMTGHRTPKRLTLCRQFRIKRSQLDELERRWELFDEVERFRLVARCVRLIQADRIVGRQD